MGATAGSSGGCESEGLYYQEETTHGSLLWEEAFTRQEKHDSWTKALQRAQKPSEFGQMKFTGHQNGGGRVPWKNPHTSCEAWRSGGGGEFDLKHTDRDGKSATKSTSLILLLGVLTFPSQYAFCLDQWEFFGCNYIPLFQA